MLHLATHLAKKAIIGRPVQFHWMYYGEQRLYMHRSHVHNRAYPVGPMAEGYIVDEFITLCSSYLHGIQTRFNHPGHNYDGEVKHNEHLSIFAHPGRPLGATLSLIHI